MKHNPPHSYDKKCKDCSIVKDASQFTPMSRMRSGRSNTCKECLQKRRKNRVASNPDLHHDRRLKTKFGIGLQEYKLLLSEQKGCCAICSHKPDAGKYLHVDHDHESNKIRGLLCMSCNTALGQLRECGGKIAVAAFYVISGGFTKTNLCAKG